MPMSEELADLDPLLGTELGLRPGADGLPDLSPAGQQAADELARRTLTRLDAAAPTAGTGQAAGTGQTAGIGQAAGSGPERRCARLLRERLGTELALSEQGEHLRAVSNIFAPVHRVRRAFLMHADRRPPRTGRWWPAGWPGWTGPWPATGHRWPRARAAACSPPRGRCAR